VAVDLPNKPLIEALLEVHWPLSSGQTPELLVDKVYPFLVGSLFDKMSDDYPLHERLPAADAPDEFTPYVVKHRLLGPEGAWPVVQLGPGVATLNSTQEYSWEDFEARANHLVLQLADTYERHADALVFNSLSLRYINAFDVPSSDITEFFNENLNVSLTLPTGMESPGQIGFSAAYDLPNISSRGTVACAVGTVHSQPKIVLDLQISATQDMLPRDSRFSEWLSGAHTEIERWFFAFIEGPLRKRFEVSA
jgi:uncharacterized protein (TIGR04255 family)